MTSTAIPVTDTPGAGLSARTRVEYDRDWALFTDWCAAADRAALPADPATVVEFLKGCLAAAATLSRRVAAIDSRHTAAGLNPPGRAGMVRAALGRPPRESAPTISTEHLHTALHLLPSRGWTVGLFGRRDRVLLVLTAAGADSRRLAAATAGNLTVGEGTATLRAGSAVIALYRGDDDPVVCGPCAAGRWLRLLRLIATTHSHRHWIDALHHSPAVTQVSPHQCTRPVVLDDATAAVPLLPRIDQWGYLDTKLEPVGPRSLTTLSRRLSAGRRSRPGGVPPPAEPEPTPLPVPVPGPAGGDGVYTRERWQEAWQRRLLQNQQAADIDQTLRELEIRTKDLLQQSHRLLEV